MFIDSITVVTIMVATHLDHLARRTAAPLPAVTVVHRLRDIYTETPPNTADRIGSIQPRGTADRAWRAQHHIVMLVTAGQGTHMIDFVRYQCRPGTVLWGRPGQVHRLGGEPGLDAVLLLFPPAALTPQAAGRDGWEPPDDAGATCWQPAGEDEEAIAAGFAQIGTDIVRHSRGELPALLVRYQLAVLLMRITALAPVPGVPALPDPAPPVLTETDRPAGSVRAADLVRRLRGELERDVRHRPVEWYAERLGCSVRTLTRACLAETGRGAKQLVDERVALEARRILATTTLPAAMVAQRLGFSEPTNFGRFFSREVGYTPGEFRAAIDRQPRAATRGAAHEAPRGAGPVVTGGAGPEPEVAPGTTPEIRRQVTPGLAPAASAGPTGPPTALAEVGRHRYPEATASAQRTPLPAAL